MSDSTAKRQKAQARARRRHIGRNPRRDTYIGIAVLVIGVLGFYFSLTKEVPFVGQSGRIVSAEFAEPNQLQPGVTPVRVDGVDVGTVSRVSATDGGRYGTVQMRITNSTVMLHSDATAAVKWRTLLGANFAIDIDPGSPSALPLSGPIPLSHTSVQQEFDDVNGIFSGNAPDATRTDLKQLGAAMKGAQLGALLDTLAPALRPVPAAFRAVQGTLPGDLAGLVRSAADTTRTLGRSEQSLQTLIAGGDATLGATATQSSALGRALETAPGSEAATVSVARSVEQTLPSLDRLVSALHPGAAVLAPAAAAATPAVNALRTVLTRARPLLRSLRPAVAQLSAASVPGRTLVQELQPTVTRLNTQLIPYLARDDSDLHVPLYELIGPTFGTLGSAASEFDNSSHVIHFPIQPEADSLPIVPCTVFVAAPTPSELLNCANLQQVLSVLLGSSSTSVTGSSGGTGNGTSGVDTRSAKAVRR